MALIDAEEWSAHKLMMHPNRSYLNVDSFLQKQEEHAEPEHYLNAKGVFLQQCM